MAKWFSHLEFPLFTPDFPLFTPDFPLFTPDFPLFTPGQNPAQLDPETVLYGVKPHSGAAW